MIFSAPYSDRPEGSNALLLHMRRKGQRWYSLVCFGRKGHYYEDGGCEHTDALIASLTPYGKKVTKVDPFGGKPENRPKRPRKRQCPKREAVGA